MTLLSFSPIPWIVGLVVFIAFLFLFKWARREGREERGEIERDITDKIYDPEVWPKAFKRKS